MKQRVPELGEFRLTERGLKRVLGPLEAAIMQLLWKESPLTVRDMLERLQADDQIAYNTVMTVAHRLFQKRLLKRRRVRTAHRYWPTVTREELENLLVERIIEGLLEDFPHVTRRHVARVRRAV